MNHQRINNFLPRDVFSDIQSFLMEGDMMWSYRNALTDGADTCGFHFSGDVFHAERKQCDVPLLEKVGVPIISRLPMSKLIRIKINCYPRQVRVGEDNFPKSSYHIDLDYPHHTAILGINTNNGYTEFDDGTKLESIENSLIMFEGNQRHRAVGCTDENIRVNININWMEDYHIEDSKRTW